MPTNALAKLLSLNSAYTAVCGLIAVAGASVLAVPFGVSEPMALPAVGVFLIVVAVAMAGAAAMVRRSIIPAVLLTVGDVGYVLASVSVVAVFPLSGLGKSVTLGVAAVVAVFVLLQGKAIRQNFSPSP